MPIKTKAKRKKQTKTEIVEATAPGIESKQCPRCKFPTSPEMVDAIRKMVELRNKHPFSFQDVRWCPKCRIMWYILPPGVTKEEART